MRLSSPKSTAISVDVRVVHKHVDCYVLEPLTRSHCLSQPQRIQRSIHNRLFHSHIPLVPLHCPPVTSGYPDGFISLGLNLLQAHRILLSLPLLPCEGQAEQSPSELRLEHSLLVRNEERKFWILHRNKSPSIWRNHTKAAKPRIKTTQKWHRRCLLWDKQGGAGQ